MHLRKILSGTLAILLLSSATASAGPLSGGADIAPTGFSMPLPGVELPFGLKREPAPVQMAQAGDQRVPALEEQVRRLSGTIEELNFQILQMQEQLRKMQEDNEFRFQELEQKRSDAGAPGAGTNRTAAAPQSGRPTGAVPGSTGRPAVGGTGEAVTSEEEPDPSSIQEVIILDDGTGNPGTTIEQGRAGMQGGTGATIGEPPRSFGTITFDDKGNVTGGSASPGDVGRNQLPPPAQPQPRSQAPSALPSNTAQAPATPNLQADQTVVAALPATDDPEELYRNSYEFILSGDYATAESGFRDHIARFPGDSKTADARFWLGEAQLGQKHYRDAAETFLSANKEFPSARKAPDMLLKLGVSLVGLDQKDVACATFGEIGRRYPNISGALKQRVKQEQALASC